MQIGTDVVDYRQHRSLGYWDGSGLSQSPPRSPRKAADAARPADHPGKPSPARGLLRLARADPKSAFARGAATWILLNAPGGVEVGPAAEIILSEHAASSNLVFLCQRLVRAHFAGEKALLRDVLEQNPHDTVKAHACYALATLLRDEAVTGGNLTAEAEAEQLFERVVTDFGEVTSDGMLLADRADRQLADLQRRKLDRNGVIRWGQ